MEKISYSLLTWTEKKLTLKKAKKKYQKDHKTFLSEVLDWIDAIVFAVIVVFFINQWLFQLFVIPSPSMESTLMTGDRVLVSKLTYGVELYPEGPKVFSSRTPDRGDIITFYNPESESRGALFNILSQFIFRGTFTLVNIDRKADGNIREALLVKRAAAVAGDTVTFRNGDAYIKASGTNNYIDERLLNPNSQRTISSNNYVGYNAQAILDGLYNGGISVSNLPKHLVNDINNNDYIQYMTYDYYTSYFKGQRMADPTDFEARSMYSRYKTGVYVPEGCVLPLGDNRDNSQDGRYFGPVSTDMINGKVVSKVWPLS